ncbi:MAG: hypothetical protein SOV85_13790 [Clostridium sp.]|uniref:hypothetical protein n=1 Tax=Clostridium sp. TaxID=1506 RepID=UPI002A764FD9|nr:hypothetical protein [Clostridium sp.]MDY2632403.1 hypothetical protein [Clostridium sp.]
MSNIAIEAAKEIQNIAQENNVDVHNLIEQYKKAHNFTDQSKSYEHDIENFKDIIPLGTDIDNKDLTIQKGDMCI